MGSAPAVPLISEIPEAHSPHGCSPAIVDSEHTEHTEHTELEPSYGTPHLRGGDTPPGDGDSAMEPIDSI